MKWARVLVASLLLAALVNAGTSRGTAPRADASRYPAHAQMEGMAVGARLLTPEQARSAFVTEVNRCCIVVEVGLYPEKNISPEISQGSFTLRVANTDTAAKPASAKMLAALLQKKASASREVAIYPTAGIGYESGSGVPDRTTGQRRGGGVTTSVGVGVGVGPTGMPPGSTDRDREVMETELSEKGLPEGKISGPVAGYLYVPLTWKKNVAYQLEYNFGGNSIVLRLR